MLVVHHWHRRLVAVGVFEVVAGRWDSSMALCADSEEAHDVEG